MAKRNIIYTLVTFAFLMSALYSGEKILYVAAYVLLMLPIISGLALLVTVLRYKYFEDISTPQVQRGQKRLYTLNVSNEDIFVYPYIRVVFYTGHLKLRSDFNDQLFYLWPGKSYTLQKEVYCKHIGVYDIGVKSFEFRDFFGLFNMRISLRAEKKQVKVYPRMISLQNFKLFCTAYQDASQSSMKKGMEDRSEITEVKKYASGESLKNIHWKLSAKRNELMTKKFNIPHNRSVFVYCDLNIAHQGEDFLDVKDMIIESCIAVLNDCLLKGIPATLFLNDASMTTMSINNRKSFEAIYEMLFKMPFKQQMTVLADIIHANQKRNIKTQDTVLITSNTSEALFNRLIRLKVSGEQIGFIHATISNGQGSTFDQKFINGLTENGIYTYILQSADDIQNVLNQTG